MFWPVDYFSAYLYGLRLITLILLILFCLDKADDLFIDLIYWGRRLWRAVIPHQKHALSGMEPEQIVEKPLAIVLPVSQAGRVIGKSIATTIHGLEYENYHIFIAVRADDQDSLVEVDELCARFPNVHKVVIFHSPPGDDLYWFNVMRDDIFSFENIAKLRFSGFILHDAGDLISPLELRLFNSLLEHNDLIQIPIDTVKPKWTHFSSLSDRDEFAEWQDKELTVRNALTGRVQVTGRGTCFSRRALLALKAQSRECGLFGLRQKDMETVFCNFPVIIQHNRKVKHANQSAITANVISVLRCPPASFTEAVEKKTGWFMGGVKRYHAADGGTFTYSLFRDRKKIAGWLFPLAALLIGIQLLTLEIYEQAAEDPWRFLPIIENDSWIRLLLWLSLLLAANRVIQRAACVACRYGAFEGAMALPRMIWGGVINFRAGLRATAMFIHGEKPEQIGVKSAINCFHPISADPTLRPLGQVLIEQGVVTPMELKHALENRTPGLRLGGSMIQSGKLTPWQLALALAEQANVPVEPIDMRDLDPQLVKAIPAKIALHYAVLPLRKETNVLVLACENVIDPVSLAALRRKLKVAIRYVIVPRGQVVVGLRYWYGHQQIKEKHQLLERAVAGGLLNQKEAAVLWNKYVSGQILFAEILVSEHRLDDSVLKAVLLRYENYDMPFGEFLVQEGVVDQRAVDHALARQKKLQPSLLSLMQQAGIGRLQLSHLAGQCR